MSSQIQDKYGERLISTPRDFKFIDSIAVAGEQDFVDGDVDTTDNELDITAHGFSANQKVQLLSTGTLPAGLAAATDYYVTVISANAISLALTAGGADVDITAAAGGGTHTVVPVEYSQAARTMFNTGIDALVGPTMRGRIYCVLFAEDAAVINALIAAADESVLSLAVQWINTASERYGISTYTESREAEAAETPSGFSVPNILRVEAPYRYLDQWAWTLALPPALAQAITGENLKIGLDFE
jgi:hypothetical protein